VVEPGSLAQPSKKQVERFAVAIKTSRESFNILKVLLAWCGRQKGDLA
jgi:hypothetical protein